VVIVEPMKKPYAKIIPNTLDAMRDIVGGYIEVVRAGRSKTGKEFIITVNEEGKLMGLTPNRMIVNFDLLVGTFFISAANLKGDNVTLSDEEAQDFIMKFTALEVELK
jgi:hypothetical protein